MGHIVHGIMQGRGREGREGKGGEGREGREGREHGVSCKSHTLLDEKHHFSVTKE